VVVAGGRQGHLDIRSHRGLSSRRQRRVKQEIPCGRGGSRRRGFVNQIKIAGSRAADQEPDSLARGKLDRLIQPERRPNWLVLTERLDQNPVIQNRFPTARSSLDPPPTGHTRG